MAVHLKCNNLCNLFVLMMWIITSYLLSEVFLFQWYSLLYFETSRIWALPVDKLPINENCPFCHSSACLFCKIVEIGIVWCHKGHWQLSQVSDIVPSYSCWSVVPFPCSSKRVEGLTIQQISLSRKWGNKHRANHVNDHHGNPLCFLGYWRLLRFVKFSLKCFTLCAYRPHSIQFKTDCYLTLWCSLTLYCCHSSM